MQVQHDTAHAPRPAVDPAGADARIKSVLSAISESRRTGSSVPLPQHGLTIEWDDGAVASCDRCGISWRVSRARYRTAGWWTCPRGCREHA